MAGYNPLNLGNQPNDGLGDGGRTGGAKINAMFQELYYTRFLKDGRIVERLVHDPANVTATNYKSNDIVRGWADPTAKTRWVEGVILDATIVLTGENPAHIDDETKFFLTNEVLKVS